MTPPPTQQKQAGCTFIIRAKKRVLLVIQTTLLSALLILTADIRFTPQAATLYPHEAAVSYLQGSAMRTNSNRSRTELKPQTPIQMGDRILTGKSSHLEVILPDQSKLRFHQDSEFIIKDLFFSTSLSQRLVKVILVKGKLWANIKDSPHKRSRFEIHFQCSQARIRKAILRVVVSEDHFVMAKLYQGEAVIIRPPIINRPPQPTLCPQENPAAKKVSWSHLLPPMHQMIIFPDGQATRPYRFAAKTDRNSWVLWNQKRDQLNSVHP